MQLGPAAVLEGLARLLHRQVDLRLAAAGDLVQGLAGRGIDAVEGLAGGRGARLAVDEGARRQGERVGDGAVFFTR